MRFTLLSLLLIIGYSSNAQNKFVIENSDEFENVHFKFISPQGSTQISPTDNPHLINVIADIDELSLKVFKKEIIKDNTKDVIFKIDAPSSSGEDDKLNYNQLNRKAKSRTNIYLSKKKKYNLDLIFGFGKVDLDFSGLPIESLEIYSQKTELNLSYSIGIPNAINMKLMKLKSDFGNVTINRAEYLNAKLSYIILGSGDVNLKFVHPPELTSRYRIKIDKGDIKLSLPPDLNAPVKLSVKENPLCDINVPEGFTKKGEIYVNASYYNNAPKALIFDIDVAWGDIKIEQ